MKTRRQYIPAYGADSEAITHGLKWLINDSGNIGNVAVAIHVPSMERILHARSILAQEIGQSIVHEFRKTGKIKIHEKEITVITDRKQPKIDGKVLRVLSCWPDSDSLARLEGKYQISDILVITWNYKKDIDKWKLHHLPEIYQDYTPSVPQEF